jgi:hypothetical protein
VAGASLPAERELVLLEDQSGQLGLRAATWAVVPRGKRPQLFDLASDPGQDAALEDAPPGLPDRRPTCPKLWRVRRRPPLFEKYRSRTIHQHRRHR